MGEDQLSRREMLAVLGGSAAGIVALDRSLQDDDCNAYQDPVYEQPTHSVTVADQEYACDVLDAPVEPVNGTMDGTVNGTQYGPFNETEDMYDGSIEDCCEDT